MSEASVGLEPGVVLDRYELLCAIARGGMADVWLGRLKGRHGFAKLVAIKTILPEHALENRFQRMFLDEARIASGIDHPNVAKILDLGEWRECLYLVMEYVDGDSLSRLRRGIAKRNIKMTTAIALRILSDTCAGLHAAHELPGDDGQPLGVVHRDISPQNVLVPNNGSVKLIDFGVAKARDRLGDETGAGHTKGKSRYMAPEQALANAIDRRADIFAVGAMAYELFVGSTPYDGDTDMARLHALITGPPVTKVPNAPHPSIEALIVKALARDPEKRFATAAELRTALEDAMVKMRLRATPEDVAAFLARNTQDRIEERKRVVKLALDLAQKRDSIKDELERDAKVRAVADSQQSISDVSLPVVSPPKGLPVPPDSAPLPPDPASGSEPVAAPTLPVPAAAASSFTPEPVATSAPPSSATPAVPPPPPLPTEVVASSPPATVDVAGDPRRRRLIPVVAAVLGLMVVIGLAALAFRRTPDAGADTGSNGGGGTTATTTGAPGSVAMTSSTPTETATALPPTTATASVASVSPSASARPTATAHPTTRPTGRPTGRPTSTAAGTRTAKPKGSDVVIQ